MRKKSPETGMEVFMDSFTIDILEIAGTICFVIALSILSVLFE